MKIPCYDMKFPCYESEQEMASGMGVLPGREWQASV